MCVYGYHAFCFWVFEHEGDWFGVGIGNSLLLFFLLFTRYWFLFKVHFFGLVVATLLLIKIIWQHCRFYKVWNDVVTHFFVTLLRTFLNFSSTVLLRNCHSSKRLKPLTVVTHEYYAKYVYFNSCLTSNNFYFLLVWTGSLFKIIFIPVLHCRTRSLDFFFAEKWGSTYGQPQYSYVCWQYLQGSNAGL